MPPNNYFRFKQFTVRQDKAAMKVTTDGCLFGAWCAAAIAALRPVPGRLLDIGAGSGLLSLMVAQQTTGMIEAVEIDPEAALQAGENMAASPWNDRVQVAEGDVRTMETSAPFDVIFSNPPFYEQELVSPVAGRRLAHHDTGMGLAELATAIDRLLSPSGKFYLLLPYKRMEEVKKILASRFALESLVIVHASVQHPPIRLLLSGSREKNMRMNEERLDIRGPDGAYSPAFTALLKEYYLHL